MKFSRYLQQFVPSIRRTFQQVQPLLELFSLWKYYFSSERTEFPV
jgi:hypothetical protein